MGRKSFVLYTEIEDAVNALPRESRGDLFTAILHYVSAGEEPGGLDAESMMAFRFIRSQLDRDSEKYERTVAARTEAGRKGGQAKRNKQTEANVANATFDKQTEQEQANQADNVDVNVDVDVNVNDKEREIRERPGGLALAVMADYNLLAKPDGLPRAARMTRKRIDLIEDALRTFGAVTIHDVFCLAAESAFLTGGNERGWRANIDWLLRPDNFTRVLEGAYDDRASPGPKAGGKGKTRFHNFTERGIDYDALLGTEVTS